MSTKKITFQYLATMFKVFSCEKRLFILDYLIEKGTASNKQLALALGCSQSSVSENLNKLVVQNMIEPYKCGSTKYYRINLTLLQNFNLITELVDESGKI